MEQSYIPFKICTRGDAAALPPYEFVLGEKKIDGSCAGIGNDWAVAISLLNYKRVDPAGMCSMIVPLSGLEDALNEIRANKKLTKVLVSPEAKEKTVF